MSSCHHSLFGADSRFTSCFRAMPPTRRRGGRGRGPGPGPRPAGVCDFDSTGLQTHIPMDLVLGYAHAALRVVPDIESRIAPLIMAVMRSCRGAPELLPGGLTRHRCTATRVIGKTLRSAAKRRPAVCGGSDDARDVPK